MLPSSRSTPGRAATSTPTCWPAGWRSCAPADGSLVFVENVGNLVCPALFDLGEAARVVVVSVTEGEDKPLKYPQMFAAADLVVVNKIDLLPYVDVRLEQLIGTLPGGQAGRPGPAPVGHDRRGHGGLA